MGKKITLNEAETSATITEATLGDVVTTIIDPKVALTGMHKYLQTGLGVVAGMAVDRYRTSGSVQFWQAPGRI